MKRWIYFLGHLAIITILTSFASFGGKKEQLSAPLELLATAGELHRVAPKSEFSQTQGSAPSNTVFLGKSFIGFKEAVGFKESQGRYDAVNTLGYLGKYQFGANTLALFGITDLDGFMEDPMLQEQVFELNVSRNKWILRRDIKRFTGKVINGVKVSESGILAAAHLAGAGNVKKYLRSHGMEDLSDAYGSTIGYYIKRFQGYDISLIEAHKNPKISESSVQLSL